MSSPISLLAQFPIEILDIIFSFSNTGILAINLWKCGSKQLNYRLSIGGITSIALKDHNPDSTSRFPKMLFSLQKLRSLSIDRYKCVLAGAYELRNLLLQLSPTLERLKLICREAESCFFRHPQPNEIHGCFEPSPDIQLEMPPESTSPDSPLWDVGAKFPLLNTLLVSCPSSSILSSCGQWLPSSLTDLSILAFDPPCIDVKIRRYPPNLVRLTTGLTHLDYCILPTSLQYLYAERMHIVDEHIRKLPACLQFCDAQLSLTPTTAQSLPPPLQSLNVSFVDYDAFEALGLSWVDHLPRFLTQLTLHQAMTLTRQHLRALPRSVTRLHVFKIRRSSLTDEADFPPALVDLTCACNTINADFVSKLPRRLTTLVVPNGRIHDDGFSHLPPHLTHLDLASVALLSVCDFPHWPRTLTTLQVRRVVFLGPFDPTGLRPVKDRFPPHLETLAINWETPRWQDLPDSLLTYVSASSVVDQFCKLPRKLTKLSLWCTEPPTKQALQDLPPTLTHLTMNLSSPKRWPTLEEDLFSGLPSSLEYLDFPYATTEMLVHLPTTLKELHVKMDEVTEQTLKALPRKLWHVELNGLKNKPKFEIGTLVDLLPPTMVAASRVSQGFFTTDSTRHSLQRPLGHHA